MSEGRHQTASAMRHGGVSRAAARRRRRARLALGIGLVLVIGATSAFVWRTRSADAHSPAAASSSTSAGCPAPATLTVAVTAGDAAPMEELAGILDARPEGAVLPCARLTVVRSRIGDDGLAAVAPGTAAVFGGVAQMTALDAGVTASGATTAERTAVATTLAVLAMPRAMAQAAGWDSGPVSWKEIAATVLDPDAWTKLGRPEFGTFSVSLADPATAGATRAILVGISSGVLGTPVGEVTSGNLGTPEVQNALLTLDRRVTRSTPDEGALVEALASASVAGALLSSTSAALLEERSVWSYNKQDPATALVAVYPEGGAPSLDLTWATVDGPSVTDSQRAAATAIGAYLLSADGQQLLASHGLRRVDGGASDQLTPELGVSRQAQASAVTVPAAVLDASAAGWRHMRNPGRFLVIIDVSGSMADTVAGTGRTKLQFAQDAAVQGIRLVPSSAEIGLWEFATLLDGPLDYHELVGVGPVGDLMGGGTRLDQLVAGVGGLTPRTDTALYDTALAAFRSMRATYQAGEPNVIILITDGRNDDPTTVGLDAFVSAVSAEQNPDQPVRLITLAYGADADEAALARMAEATGGTPFTSPNPADIGTVFFKALNAG